MIPANIPSPQLPAAYESAKTALATCERVDECKDWADKAAALASYARQANDQSLMQHAQRIRARAIRRAGELIEQIEAAPGARTDMEPKGDAPPRLTRREVSAQAGLSVDQQKQAQRVARVPAEQFEAMVESDDVATITALAEIGTTKSPAAINRSQEAWGTLKNFSRWTADNPAREIAEGFMEHEVAPAKDQARRIVAWLRELDEAFGD